MIPATGKAWLWYFFFGAAASHQSTAEIIVAAEGDGRKLSEQIRAVVGPPPRPVFLGAETTAITVRTTGQGLKVGHVGEALSSIVVADTGDGQKIARGAMIARGLKAARPFAAGLVTMRSTAVHPTPAVPRRLTARQRRTLRYRRLRQADKKVA